MSRPRLHPDELTINAAVWEAEVTKMIKAFGAVIDDSDAKAIVEYLKNNYGS